MDTPISNITSYQLRWNPRVREITVVLETAGGEPWTMRRQRQAILGLERHRKVGLKQKEMACSFHGPMLHRD